MIKTNIKKSDFLDGSIVVNVKGFDVARKPIDCYIVFHSWFDWVLYLNLTFEENICTYEIVYNS